MDKGFKELIAGVLVPMHDKGVPLPHEALLDGAGRRLGNLLTPCYMLKDTGIVNQVQTASPKFQFYYRMPFYALGF